MPTGKNAPNVIVHAAFKVHIEGSIILERYQKIDRRDGKYQDTRLDFEATLEMQCISIDRNVIKFSLLTKTFKNSSLWAVRISEIT